MKLIVTGIFFVLTLTLTQTTNAQDLNYKVHARGIEAANFNLRLNINGNAYSGSASRRATALARALLGNSQDYDYNIAGTVVNDQLFPGRYQHSGGRHGRIVNVLFSYDSNWRATNVETTVETADHKPGSMGMGNPPATLAQKLGSIDMLSMFLRILTTRENPCTMRLPLFLDGRTRFDLQMRPSPQPIRVPAKFAAYNPTGCIARFIPIAGFSDPQQEADLNFVYGKRDGDNFTIPLIVEMPSDDVGTIRLEAEL